MRRCRQTVLGPAFVCISIADAGCSRQEEPAAPVPTPRASRAVMPPKITEAPPQILPMETGNIVDSNMTLEQALAGKDIPRDIRKNLVLIDVDYWSFDGHEHSGQLVIHEDLAEEVKAIFADIKDARFPIERMAPVSKYAWSDEASMANNNSSSFNYRSVQGWRRLSEHAYGRAIDINPRLNPYVKDGVSLPPGAVYSPEVPGSITANGPVVEAFRKRNWKWGGGWRKLKDWQHFERAE
jgi:peptidoglycan L-alanyl-D-glutamate endopeptidase CwlK